MDFVNIEICLEGFRIFFWDNDKLETFKFKYAMEEDKTINEEDTKYNINDIVRLKSIANVARRYLGRKGIIKAFDTTVKNKIYYGLRMNDRVSLLWVLEGEIDKEGEYEREEGVRFTSSNLD